MKVQQVVLLLVAVVVVISAFAHILGAQQQQQLKTTKKLLKISQNKKLVRALMESRRDALMCTRAMAGERPVVVFQIENLHVLADQTRDYLKPIAAFEDRQDIYEFCVERGEPLREIDQVVFVPGSREPLGDKPKKKEKSGWFSKVKRFIGLESTTEETLPIAVKPVETPDQKGQEVKTPVKEMFKNLAMPF